MSLPLRIAVIGLSIVACSAPTHRSKIIEMQPDQEPASSPDPRRTNLAHVASTAEIQGALAENGISVPVDGKMGPQTKTALRTFQQKNKLKVTGIADPATLSKLGL